MLIRPYARCFLVAPLIALLTGCGLYFRHWPTGDGNTWQVNAAKVTTDCNGFSSTASCITALQPDIEAHATEICGKKPYRVFLCEKLDNAASGFVGIGCKVQCNEAVQVQVVGNESNTNTDALNADIMNKAKKCQAKGGVWLNNTCQISVN